MKCNRVMRRLSAYADGEMSGREKAVISRHLEECAACREELARLRTDIGLLRSAAVPEQPAFLMTRVMAEVRAAGLSQASGGRVWWQRALPVAAAAVLGAAGLWFGAVVGAEFGRESATQEVLFDGDAQSFADFTESVFAGE